MKARGWRTSYSDVVPAELLAGFGEPAHWLDDMTRSATTPDRFLDIAIDGTTVVGMAQGRFRPRPYVSSLHVLPERRGGRIGARLMAGVAQAAIGRGHRELGLDVVTSNTRAIAFYERLGAIPVEEHPAAWADGVTELRMLVADLPELVRLVGANT